MLWVVLCISFPALLIALGCKLQIIDRIGLVLLCFASGIVINTASSAFGVAAFTGGHSADFLIAIQTQITELTIALAIPLLVMSIHLKAAIAQAGKTAKSTFAAFASILLCTVVLSMGFNGHIEQLWQVAGLAVGAYTGGGPNMAAINAAIEGDQSIFVRMTSYDIMLSALFLLFVLSIAKPIFSRFLPAFDDTQHDIKTNDAHHFSHLSEERAASYLQLAHLKNIGPLFGVLLIAAFIVGASVFISSLLPESMQSSSTIILITTLGMLASFVPQVRKLTLSFRLGMYLVLVFCFTMGSMTNLSILMSIDVALFSYIGLMLISALVLHALICRVIGVDVDTFLVTASAAIMSVPFIPVIVGALRNKALLIPGFCAAIAGYVLGNYFGIAISLALKSML